MRAGDFVIAVDFGGTKVAVASATPSGELIAGAPIPAVGRRVRGPIVTALQPAAANEGPT